MGRLRAGPYTPARLRAPHRTRSAASSTSSRHPSTGIPAGRGLTAVDAVALLFAVFVSEGDETVAVFETVVPAALKPAFTTS